MYDVRYLIDVGGGIIYRLHVSVNGVRGCIVVRYSYRKHAVVWVGSD